MTRVPKCSDNLRNFGCGATSAGFYKGRLRGRGDSVPLTHTSFASSPTFHRGGVKVMCMLAVLFPLQMRSSDVIQAFLQSGNLAESDRRISTPPPIMVKLPWAGALHRMR